MNTWKAADAKRHFSKLISSSHQAPQLVLLRDKPVSVVVSYERFARSEAMRGSRSMDDWLDELAGIHESEGDPEPPARSNRREQFSDETEWTS